MKDSILCSKSKIFAKEIVLLCRKLKCEGTEAPLVHQLLRCGTSIGANIYEAQYAQSSKDFISKFEIALKETSETEYWLELLTDVGNLSAGDFERFRAACIELRRMLVSSVTTLKQRLQDHSN